MTAAGAGIERYLTYFNTTRRHQGLGNDTPDAVYFRKAENKTQIKDRQTNPIMSNDHERIAA